MKRKIYLLFIIFVITFSQSIPQERLRDYFIMLDVSGSMVGKGDGKGINVFDDVKKWIKEFIKKTNEGEVIVIYPFERGLVVEEGKYFKRVIRTENDKNDAYKFIDNLIAEGPSTWLTESFATLTRRINNTLNELIKDYDKFERDQIIFIYTDGKGNGPLDTNIDNFIEKYKFIKNDYENLLTKYVVIGDINVQIDEKDKKKLEKVGIPTEIINRDSVKNVVNLSIKPNTLLCYNYNPKITFQIADVPEYFNNKEIDLKILFDEGIPCIFDYNPKKIILGESNIFNIEIQLVETEQCLKFLTDKKIDTLAGRLIFDLKSEIIKIYPSSIIQLSYLFEPVQIKFSPITDLIRTDADEIKFGFFIRNNEYLKKEYEIYLSGKLLGKPDLAIALEPSKIKLSSQIDTFFVSLIKDTTIKSIIENISEEYLDSLELSAELIIENPNIKLDNSKFKYAISFIPVEHPILFYILIALVLIVLILYLICKVKTARFPKTAKFIQSDGTLIGNLKSKFCKSYLTLGNTPNDDLKFTISGLNESLLKITPLHGFSLRIRSINTKIKLELPDNLPSDNIVVMPEGGFYLVYESNKIEIIYRK